MFGRRLSHAGHSHHSDHPLRRRVVLTLLAAALLAAVALLIAPPHAHGNFVYWANNQCVRLIGRAKINGAGAEQQLHPGSRQTRCGRRRLEVRLLDQQPTPRASAERTSTAPASNPSFITTGVTDPTGIAVTLIRDLLGEHDGGPTRSVAPTSTAANPQANFITARWKRHLRAGRRLELPLLGQHGGARIGRRPRRARDRRTRTFTTASRIRRWAGGRPDFLYWGRRHPARP